MAPILFICTGNIFRSVIAECAFNTVYKGNAALFAASAGTEAKPQAMHPYVVSELQRRGADPTAHRQRRLTAELVATAGLPLAMGLDHRAYVKRVFGREVPLFNEICHGVASPVLDLWEAHPNWASEPPDVARRYVQSVIAHIFDSMPLLIAHATTRLGAPLAPARVPRMIARS